MGAAANLRIPPRGIDGTRQTVNSGLSSMQAAWNLRSAYNVAALNCRAAQHAPILSGYADFLKSHSRTLSSINKALDREFKEKYGSNYIREREAFQTQVYNYFALPPVLPAFCDAAVAVGQDLRTVSSSQLKTDAPQQLARLEAVYQDFFNRYEQYRIDLAAWEALYGSQYGYGSRASAGLGQGSPQ